jgi:hypothetical protein
LAIVDWRVKIHGLPIEDCRFGLTIDDSIDECRVLIGTSQSAILNPNLQSAIVNQYCDFPIGNQSAILNPNLQ